MDLNIVTPESVRNPWPLLDQVRAAGPVVRSEPMGGVWLVSSYEHCREVLMDPQRFSNTVFASTDFGPWFEGTDTMVHTDPPDHTRLRSMVQKVFTYRSVQQLEPRIAEIVRGLLDAPEFVAGMASGDPVDVLGDFTSALPTTVIAELLGIPTSDRKLFYRWAESMMRCIMADPRLVPQQHIDAAVTSGREMLAYLQTEIAARRKSGATDDLIGRLVQQNADGALSDDELAATCVTLLVAGSDTTTSTTTTMLSLLASHPDQRARLLEDPALTAPGIDETLRYEPTARVNFRKVLGEVELGGQRLTDGDVVWVLVIAANRDQARFDHPDRYDIGRSPNPHLTFGQGPHLCLGAQLARLEVRHAVSAFLARWPDYEVAERCPSPAYAALTWEKFTVVGGR
ncbi:cytochrome P450 [Streptomyces sp. NPDC021749]|uniref:cytochrome P450 n=1 Tax=Streptomyces sp. NPDC021749 TaxID=3154905 RepID=UPI00340EF7ED